MDQEMWQVKATACEMLAFSLRYPDAALAEAVLSGEWAEAAREVAEVAGAQLPDGFAAEDLTVNAAGERAADATALMHVLRAEATRLFIGAPDSVVSPYEGIWRAEDDGVDGLLFVNPHSMAVERFCKACGLGRPEGTNEPLDHIATELELLEYLASVEAGIVAPPDDGVAADAMPGGSAAAAFVQFEEEHLRVWASRFAAKLEEQTRLPYYRAVGQLLAAIVA